MSKNNYTALFRRESIILNPSPAGPGNTITPLLPGNPRNLTGNKLEIQGLESGENKGFYLDLTHDEWKPSCITLVKNQIKILEKNFLQYQADELSLGNQKPTEWPADLQDQLDRAEAHLVIYDEELKLIDRLIGEAEEAAKLERERRDPLLGPVKNWRRQEFSDGRLRSVAGQKLSADEDGVLFIDEPKSPYNGIYVHRWKSAILKPLMREYNHRVRQEMKLEPSERQPVKWPKPPIYHRESDSIEYPGYQPHILKNLGLL